MEYHNFSQTPGYIVGDTPLLDHIRFSRKQNTQPKPGDSRWFVRPPKLPDDEDIEMFADELVGTSQQKMVELLDHHDFLEKRRENNIGIIQSISDSNNWDEITEYFYTFMENTMYSEVIYVQRWLKYWKSIYELSAKKKFEPVFFEKSSSDEITDDDIARAKEYPLSELFDGNLKHSFGKLVGLCPFHEDSTPSFTIFEEDNHYYCFGCNAWGDSIDYYMKTNKVNMPEAVRTLNAR